MLAKIINILLIDKFLRITRNRFEKAKNVGIAQEQLENRVQNNIHTKCVWVGDNTHTHSFKATISNVQRPVAEFSRHPNAIFAYFCARLQSFSCNRERLRLENLIDNNGNRSN